MKKKYIIPEAIFIETEELLVTTASFHDAPETEKESSDTSQGTKDYEGDAKSGSLSQDIFFDDEASDW